MLNESPSLLEPTPPAPAAPSLAAFDRMMAQASAASREAAEEDRAMRARERKAMVAKVVTGVVLVLGFGAVAAFKLGKRDALRDDRARARGWDSYEQYKAAKDGPALEGGPARGQTEQELADGYERWKAEQGR